MIHRWVQILVVLTFLLLFAGGLVTSTNSGLAVPDWPLSYGTLFPPMIGGIRFEHTHRVLAATVGLLTLILTIWIGVTERHRKIRWLSMACLGAVVLQGILGALTVLFQLPWTISVAHACLGPIFFCLVVSLAVLTAPLSVIARDREAKPWRDRSNLTKGHPERSEGSRDPSAAPRPQDDALRQTASSAKNLGGLAMTMTGFVFLQISLGAVVRHTGGGVWLHVGGAFVVFVLAGLLLTRALNDFSDRLEILRPALFLGFLVTVEFFLGIATFALTRIEGIPPGLGSIIFPTLHQTLGALILAVSAVLSLGSGVGGEATEGVKTMSAFLELTKPRLVFLVLWTVTIGFLLASGGPLPLWLFLKTLAGTGLVAAGSMVLNQYIERETDAKMKRTESRPLPSSRLKPKEALAFGMILSVAGLLLLRAGVNLLTSLLAAFTLFSYLFLYTPLKSRTPWCTLAGAIPGALPPVLGWSAARGNLGWEAWVLFSILFVWQVPHFFAIAWIYRADYEKAGFQMLSVVDPTGERIGRQIMFYSLGVFLLSLLPAVTGMTGLVYYLAAFLLGIWFLAASFFTAFKLNSCSRAFFRNSVLYLTLILFFLVLDKKLV